MKQKATNIAILGKKTSGSSVNYTDFKVEEFINNSDSLLCFQFIIQII